MSVRFSVGMVEAIGRVGVLNRLADVRELATLGFGLVELWTPWNVDADDADRVRRSLADEGVAVGAVSAPAYLHGEETGEGARLLGSCIELAERLGAPLVNTYFGNGGSDDVSSVHRYAELVAPFLEQADAARVTIVLENEFDAFGHDPTHSDPSRRPPSVRVLLDEVDHPRLRANFDAANYYCAGADAAAAAALLADRVAYVHVKDAVPVDSASSADPEWKVYPDGDQLFQMVHVGDGRVPWPEVIDALRAAGYAGTFNLEPHCHHEMLPAALRHARSVVESLFG